MGSLAHVKVRAISLQEAKELLVGLKRLEKESLRKACLELQAQLSAWQLGSTLSAAAKPFIPLGYLLRDSHGSQHGSTESAPEGSPH